MPSSLDALSAVAVELTDENLDVTGAYFPVLPIPWICIFFPELCISTL